MPNTFITPSIVAKEALMVLESNTVMADLVHRDYSSEFAQVGDTITVRKPAVLTAKDWQNGDAVSAQDVTESSISVKLDRFRDVTVEVTSKQMTLDIKDFSEQIVQPAMRAHAQALDEDLLAVGVENAAYSKTATASPTNLADIADLAKKLDINKVPMDAFRRMVLHPTHKYSYALTDNLSKVAYAGNNETLRRALLGELYGFNTYMDQNAPDTTAETAGSATAFKITGTKGDSTVAVTTLSAATATLKVGDAFIIDGHLYRVTTDATGTSSAIASLAISPTLHKTISTATSVKVITKPTSLAFHKNGLALVTRQLALPMGAGKAAIASANGLAVRVVYSYDSTYKKDKISFDILYGIKALDTDMLCVLQ